MQRVLIASIAASRRLMTVVTALCVGVAAANALAQDEETAPGPSAGVEVWTEARALALMEELRAEIVHLAQLKAAQAELIGWNRERLKTGAAPVTLPGALCEAPGLAAWCARLPATFERADDEGEGGSDVAEEG